MTQPASRHDGHAPARRQMLRAAACSICGALPLFAAAATPQPIDPRLAELLKDRRTLWLRRGSEELRATYWTATGGRNQDEYLNLCWLLRDVRADRVFAMDRALLDSLAGMVVPLVGALESLEDSLIEAAYDLGGTGASILRQIVIPHAVITVRLEGEDGSNDSVRHPGSSSA